mgnify:CR=1 FL=1
MPLGPERILQARRTLTTRGNNANSREQWITASNNPPRPAGTLFQPTSATRDCVLSVGRTSRFTSKCDPANLVDQAAGLAASRNWERHLGRGHESLRDAQPVARFRVLPPASPRRRGTRRSNNFGTPPPFLGNDPVIGNAQAGRDHGRTPGFAGRDNANMNTQRGRDTRPMTNMFLWQPIAGSFYAPCVDGDYDMSVIGHEFGHMIENRMIGKGFRRSGDHAGRDGRGLRRSECATQCLRLEPRRPGQRDQSVRGGAYVTGNPDTGIRDYAMNWPMSGDFPRPDRTRTSIR